MREVGHLAEDVLDSGPLKRDDFDGWRRCGGHGGDDSVNFGIRTPRPLHTGRLRCRGLFGSDRRSTPVPCKSMEYLANIQSVEWVKVDVVPNDVRVQRAFAW